MSLLKGCEAGATTGANISVKKGSCVTDKRIASFDDRDNDDPSDDVTLKQCISGYVSGKDQAFINGQPVPFDQCCKCKPGQPCELCKIPTNCTDDEKEKFVAQDACFGTEASVSLSGKKKGECPPCPKAKESWAESIGLKKWWYGAIALLVAIILGFIIGKML
tara:strand:- start:1625 stop:2113 length:489 start_codon:yes stop_codon:yes gene_type:complete